MDARRLFLRRLLRLALVLSFVAGCLLTASSALAASARSQNFIVTAANQELANEICKAAETFRRDLAQEWLGHELPAWEQPCPITAQVDPRRGAGGATSFMFGGGRPHGWTMNIQGSRERVLDSVLPHEVTHTIFATHFGRPLPRWADEGACTTVEDSSERGKQEKLLYEFLKTNRGIPFNRMFAMKEYPSDILPLYSQGYSLARYFIALGGKPKFVQYVGEGMDTNNWTAATKKHYGFHSLSDLQLSWLEWVRKGTPEFKDASDVLYVSTEPSRNGRTLAEVIGVASPTLLASTEIRSTSPAETSTVAALAKAQRSPGNSGRSVTAMPARPEAAVADRSAKPTSDQGASATRPPVNYLPGSVTAAQTAVKTSAPAKEYLLAVSPAKEKSGEATGWYSRKRDAVRSRDPEPAIAQSADYRGETAGFSSSARPQSPEQVRQQILEWRKDDETLVPADSLR